MLGIIGGSGLERLPGLTMEDRREVLTPYGAPSAPLRVGTIAGHMVAFIARHGEGHTVPPHRVNYRANLWALREAGVAEIVAVFAVGGIAPELFPGTVIVPGQLIDYTSGRAHTFSDGGGEPVLHVDFTLPYTERVRVALLAAAAKAHIVVVPHGVYAAVNGPRLETAAEIDRLERDGATIVGMTGMPEAGLAREVGLDYAALAVSVNFAAGRGSSAEQIALDEIPDVLARSMEQACAILEQWVQLHD